MPRISVVLPIYKTAQYLKELYQRLVQTLEPLGSEFELIMIDDGSPDRAWEIVSELAGNDHRIKGIRLSRNFGQHAAISAGFEAATGDIVVLMDADLQDRPEDVPGLLKELQGDTDIVYAIKQEEHEPFLTRLTSRVYHRAVARLIDMEIPSNITSFRVFSRRVLDALLAFPERNILYGPLMFHVGFQFATVTVERGPRKGSRSSYSFSKRLALAINSLLSYTDLPQRFLVWFGLTVLGLSVLYSLALVVQYLVVGKALLIPGLTLLTLLVSSSLGAIMVGLGIIGIYIFRVYQEVLFRPRYIASRTINFGTKGENTRMP